MAPLGDWIRVTVVGPPVAHSDVTATAVADLDLVPGVEIWLSAKATDLEIYRAPSPRQTT